MSTARSRGGWARLLGGAKDLRCRLYCNGGKCIEAKDVGEDCSIPEECGSVGFCNEAGKCEMRRKVSAACTDDVQCTAAVCYEYQGKKSCTDRIVLARSEPLCEELRSARLRRWI